MRKSIREHACFYLTVSLNLYSVSPIGAQPSLPGPGSERELIIARRGNDACSGVVSQFLLNPKGDVDGMLLANNIQIHFPPHMGIELIKAIKVGERVTVNGIRQNTHVFDAWQVIGEKKIAVVDGGPPRPPGPPRPVASTISMQVHAHVRAVLYGPRGDVNGFMLSDRTIVRMPPETAFSFSNILQPGQEISVKGYGYEGPLGRCIEAVSIGTDGQPMIPIYNTDFAKPLK